MLFRATKRGLIEISRSFFKQFKNPSLITHLYALEFFGNILVIFGYIWEEIVFFQGLLIQPRIG